MKNTATVDKLGVNELRESKLELLLFETRHKLCKGISIILCYYTVLISIFKHTIYVKNCNNIILHEISWAFVKLEILYLKLYHA